MNIISNLNDYKIIWNYYIINKAIDNELEDILVKFSDIEIKNNNSFRQNEDILNEMSDTFLLVRNDSDHELNLDLKKDDLDSSDFTLDIKKTKFIESKMIYDDNQDVINKEDLKLRRRQQNFISSRKKKSFIKRYT